MGNQWKASNLGLGAVCAMGFSAPQCSGLNACDFQQINVSGFDTADDAVDGYVDVGTGNNMSGLIGFYIDTLMNGGSVLDAPVRPPEIRRYRRDLGPTTWETVFDYRAVETDPNFRTSGFRFLKAFDSLGEAPSPWEVWVSDNGLDFRTISQGGFGDVNNRGVRTLIAYNGHTARSSTHGDCSLAEREALGSVMRAVLQRDGFVSVNAGPEPGWFSTPRLVFSGRQLVLNVDTGGGHLRVEIQDAQGAPVLLKLLLRSAKLFAFQFQPRAK